MNKYQIAADSIKNNVSALDVAKALGLEIRHGRCKCPIHGGNDYNCRLYPGNRGYVCWVCKSGGDVIKFVQESQGLGFKAAISWLDSTFHLGLELDSPIDPAKQRAAEIALQRRKREHELQEWKKQMRFNLALLADRITERLEEIRDEHRPRTYGNWDEEFYMAVRLLPEALAFTEECETECIEGRRPE